MRWILSAPLLTWLLVSASGLSITATGDATPADHDHGHAAAGPDAATPYADQYDPDAVIRSLAPDEIDQIRHGEGAGFALPAELNGLPGPRHVLDLDHELHLSHEQRMQVQHIYDEMWTAVVPAGEAYLAAVEALEQDIRKGSVTEETLAERVADVYRLEGELATAHLVAHLRTAEILTAEQIDQYQRLRGYEQ